MKKMTFALACSSTLALLAADLAPKATFEDAGVGDKVSEYASGTHWLYMGASGSEDNSAVAQYGEVTAPADAGDKYLELSTEGGTLWRSVNEATDANTLGTAQAIGENGIYIDTLVQFTATEDGNAPEVDPAKDKLAIWLDSTTSSEGVTTTTLKLLAGFTDDNGSTTTVPKTYTLVTPRPVVAGEWYRLTVKSIKDVAKENAANSIVGFQISLDGEVLAATEKSFGEGYMSLVVDQDWGWLQDDEATVAFLNSKTVFPSLQGYSTLSEIQAVGFKGSGKIDNLGITDENPVPPAAADVDFTITTATDVAAEWSKDGGKTWTAYTTGAKAPAGDILIKLTTTDGGVKIVTKALSEESKAFDLSSMTASDWSWYLGDADADGAFIVDNATELKSLAAKLEALGSAGITFKLGADIDMSDAGVFPCIGEPGVENITAASNAYFQGTFDGDGHTISNVTITNASKGTGLFGTICGAAKIMNLTVDTVTYENMNANKVGGGMLVGLMSGGTIENCTTKGSNGSQTMPITYNASGIINRIETRLGAVTIKDCTNEASIYCVYSKIAGICPIVEMSGATGDVTFDNCVNKGAIVGVGTAANAITGKVPGVDGVAGIVAYTQTAVAGKAIKFVNCKDQGTLTGNCCGGIVAKVGSGNITALEGNQTKADVPAIKAKGGTITGFAFATVADGVATYVADSEAKAGANLKVMLDGKTVTLANVGDSITLDTSLATATVETSAENAEVQQDGNVYTVVATGKDYPAYIDEDDKEKYDAWVEAFGITDRIDSAAALQKAYLLNVAPASAEAAEAAFKITSITVDADGKATVTVSDAPNGKFNGTVEIQGATTLAGPYAKDTANAKFFKAVLK